MLEAVLKILSLPTLVEGAERNFAAVVAKEGNHSLFFPQHSNGLSERWIVFTAIYVYLYLCNCADGPTLFRSMLLQEFLIQPLEAAACVGLFCHLWGLNGLVCCLSGGCLQWWWLPVFLHLLDQFTSRKLAALCTWLIDFIPLSSVVCLANRRFRTTTEGMTSEVAKLICFVISLACDWLQMEPGECWFSPTRSSHLLSVLLGADGLAPAGLQSYKRCC